MPTLSLSPMVILSILLALALGFGGLEYHQSSKHEAEAAAAKAQITELLAAVKLKDQTLETYKQANEQFAKDAKDQKEKLDTAAAIADTLKAQLDATQKRLKAKEDADNAIPECQKLLDTSLSICPAHIDGMRERAAGSLPGSDEHSSGTGQTGAGP